MKKIFKYNRPLAVIALAAVVVLALVVGPIRTLSGYENKLERVYDSSKAMSDLMDLHGYATKISSTGSIMGVDTAQLEKALKALNDSIYDPTGLGNSVTEVYTQVGLVYSAIDADTSTVAYMREIDSTMMRLKHNDSYNDAAAKYNEAIKSFPASIFAIGKDSAPLFS